MKFVDEVEIRVEAGDGGNGYFNGRGSDWVNWSGHTHTTGGIKGRDILGK